MPEETIARIARGYFWRVKVRAGEGGTRKVYNAI